MPGLGRLNKAAASRAKRRQYDVLLTVTAPHERLIFSVTFSLILVVLAWALLGRIEQTIKIDGVLIKPGTRHEVVSAEPGHLVEFHALPGHYVNMGDPIARQSVPELDREVMHLQHTIDDLDSDATNAENNKDSLYSQLMAARAALQGLEARRATRETIVTHIAGEVIAWQAEPGNFIVTGTSVAQIRSHSDVRNESAIAVLRVTQDIAKRIKPGMQALVEFTLPGGDKHKIEGEVESVVQGPLPNWLATVNPAVEVSLHRIDVAFNQTHELEIPDGASCQVRIVLGEATPASLLVSNVM